MRSSEIDPAHVQAFHEVARTFLQADQKGSFDTPLFSNFEPSYGNLYFEAFPEYHTAFVDHKEKIDQMMRLLHHLNVTLPEGAPVAVIGSGHGTHDSFLAHDYGLHVSGVDICQEAVDFARAKAHEAKLSIDYYWADATIGLPFEENSMKAVFCLGSAWGFDPETQRNKAVFSHIYKILQPDSIFVLDYINGQGSIAQKDTVFHTTKTLTDDLTRITEGIYDPESATQITKITLVRSGKEQVFYHYIKYYLLEEVLAFLRETGFTALTTYGDMLGHPFNPTESSQMVIIARKPVENEGRLL